MQEREIKYIRAMRKLLCSTSGMLSVRASLVMMQFGEILRSLELPQSWREEIAELCQNTSHGQDNETERILRRRAELDAEQKRLINLYQKGYVTEQALDEEMERIRAEQLTPAEQERAIMPIRQDMSFR